MNFSDTLDDNLHWYKDAILYEAHIKAYYDSNGDGIGDLVGLQEKLDHLKELGVSAIWLLPFYPSPLKDDGYDISDYYSVHHYYGSIDDFSVLLKEAHQKNLKVITELVINHTSDQHPWFERARKSPKNSPERDFYVWSDEPSKYKDVRIIFQDFETSNWSWDDVAQQYYWHRFYNHQPDLNYDNPLVQKEIFKIIDHWCSMGIDGFRLDAVPYLFEREGTNSENLPETHKFLRELRKYIDDNYPGTILLAEANMWPEDACAYFGSGDECHMNYHFPLMPRMFMAVQMEDKHPIIDIFDQTPVIPPTCQWALFLRNHDELTLEMVTDEERDYMYKTYAKDPKARINLGIRHRLAPLMENDRRKIELINSLLFSLPGTPIIYYGDEIGMGDNVYLGDRNGVRTPMQWSPDRNAGFSKANPQQLYLPVILDPLYNHETINVETQRSNTSSLLWFMKRLIGIRKKHKAFGRGDIRFLSSENLKVLAYTRTYKSETILVIVNLSKFSQPAEIDLADYSGLVPVELFSRNSFPAIKESVPYFFTLSPYSFQWFLLSKENDILPGKFELAELRIEGRKDFMADSVREALENKILAGYLTKTDWFPRTDKVILSCVISDHMVTKAEVGDIAWLFLEVNFKNGLPEYYQLPLVFIESRKAFSFLNDHPQAILAKMEYGDKSGVLCDAYYDPGFQKWILGSIVQNNQLEFKEHLLIFKSGINLIKSTNPERQGFPRLNTGTGPNTSSIAYDNEFYLKIYRKIELGLHPDVELTGFLTSTGHANMPIHQGLIELETRKGHAALAQLRRMPEIQGNCYSFMLERVNNYIERILSTENKVETTRTPLKRIIEPENFDSLPLSLQKLLGQHSSGKAMLIGKRVAELHNALFQGEDSELSPEPFSLHYQRSIYSTMHTIMREAYHNINKNKRPIYKSYFEELVSRKGEIIQKLKRIFSRRFEALKIRIHGNLSLRTILLTGKDLTFPDLGGNYTKSLTERRIKRSPLRDVASVVCSFYFVAYEGFLSSVHSGKDDLGSLLGAAETWAGYMSGFFLNAYFETSSDTLIKKDSDETQIMLEAFVLEQAFQSLVHDLKYRPESAITSCRIILATLGLK